MFEKFFKTKAVGYYLVAAAAILSLVTALVFFATYRTPDLVTQMGNKAPGYVPDTIGVFLIAGFVIELVVLIGPKNRFFQLAAIVMFGMALYKDILLFPDFIVGKINNVEYNGGNFNLNLYFFISLMVIVLLAVVAPFIGLVKEDAVEEEDEDDE